MPGNLEKTILVRIYYTLLLLLLLLLLCESAVTPERLSPNHDTTLLLLFCLSSHS